MNRRRIADAFALWTFNPAVGLRLTASNLAPGESVDTSTVIVGSLRETSTSTAPSYVNWQLRLELKL